MAPSVLSGRQHGPLAGPVASRTLGVVQRPGVASKRDVPGVSLPNLPGVASNRPGVEPPNAPRDGVASKRDVPPAGVLEKREGVASKRLPPAPAFGVSEKRPGVAEKRDGVESKRPGVASNLPPAFGV
mmetsp:Transcript_7818/g.26752  ORF Transcript_7818/g.26752 Transcript_7818/m.26752 type:complete len:128 (-) Transcript_7818:70-453(-)